MDQMLEKKIIMDPTSSSMKPEGKTNPRDEMHFLLENWNFTLPETKVQILDLYFKDVERKVKSNFDDSLREELEHSKELAERLATEFARHKIHVYIIKRERRRAFRGLLEIECFILEVIEKSIYVAEDHKDWISGITTKHVCRGDLLDLLYKVSMEEAMIDNMLFKWRVGGHANQEKAPPMEPSYAYREYLKQYTSMDNNEKKDEYIAGKRAEYMDLEEKWKEECELFNMVMDIDRKYCGISYTRKAQAIVSLLSNTIRCVV